MHSPSHLGLAIDSPETRIESSLSGCRTVCIQGALELVGYKEIPVSQVPSNQVLQLMIGTREVKATETCADR